MRVVAAREREKERKKERERETERERERGGVFLKEVKTRNGFDVKERKYRETWRREMDGYKENTIIFSPAHMITT